MIKPNTKHAILTSLALIAAHTASAHIGYGVRDFLIFQPDVVASSVTISNQTVTGDYGWADATDADFGDSHKTRAFRFNVANPGYVTVTATASAGGTKGAALLPAFSIYSGLAHVSPAAADHDLATISVAYLLSLGGVSKEGSLVALGDWKIGSDTGTTFADLSSFTYIGNAADGTSGNFGSIAGINGDGIADGTVTGTFYIPAAGDYSIFVGGALYSGTDVSGTYGITTTVTVVPEPAAGILAGIALLGFLAPRRRA
jgi:hypothetical protein